MSMQAFTQEFADLLEVSHDEINDQFNMERDAAWDSLAFIGTISLVDQYFNIILDGETLKATKTFGDLKLLIKKAA